MDDDNRRLTVLPKRRRRPAAAESAAAAATETGELRARSGGRADRRRAVKSAPAVDLNEDEAVVLRRSDIHRHGKSLPDLLFRSLSGALSKALSEARPAGEDRLFGYVPVTIFVGLSVFTLGLYPYVWFAQSARAIVSLSLEKIEERHLRRYVVMGVFVHLFGFVALVSGLWGLFADSPLHVEFAFRFAFFFAVLNLFILLPIRSFLYFGLRWNLRRAVAAWDRSHIMTPRTMPSWWKLFLFGSLYIQHHVNRVIGLGMPGFADAEEVREPLPFLEWLTGYLTGFNEPVSTGRR